MGVAITPRNEIVYQKSVSFCHLGDYSFPCCSLRVPYPNAFYICSRWIHYEIIVEFLAMHFYLKFPHMQVKLLVEDTEICQTRTSCKQPLISTQKRYLEINTHRSSLYLS